MGGDHESDTEAKICRAKKPSYSNHQVEPGSLEVALCGKQLRRFLDLALPSILRRPCPSEVKVGKPTICIVGLISPAVYKLEKIYPWKIESRSDFALLYLFLTCMQRCLRRRTLFTSKGLVGSRVT